jgi:hypothetical protein
MRSASTATKNRLMVRKKSGRLEPFDSRKMARATSRAGVSYLVALEITKAIRNDKSLEAVAKSYQRYKKTGSTKQKFERSLKGKSKARGRTVRTRAKQFAKTKDSTRGRPPRW